MPYYVVAITSIIEEAALEAVRSFQRPDEEIDVFDLRFTSRSNNLEDLTVDLIAFYAKCRKEEMERDWESAEKLWELDDLIDRFSPHRLRATVRRVYTDDHEEVISHAIMIVEELEIRALGLEFQKAGILRKDKSEFNELIDKVLKAYDGDNEPIELLRQKVQQYQST